MSESYFKPEDELTRLVNGFVEHEKPQTEQEVALIDQAAAELRDQLKNMGLVIETEEQFRVAVVISLATAVNMRQLIEMGVAPQQAEDVQAATIAAIKPRQD